MIMCIHPVSCIIQHNRQTDCFVVEECCAISVSLRKGHEKIHTMIVPANKRNFQPFIRRVIVDISAMENQDGLMSSRFKIDGGEVRILNDDEVLAKISNPEDILHF